MWVLKIAKQCHCHPTHAEDSSNCLLRLFNAKGRHGIRNTGCCCRNHLDRYIVILKIFLTSERVVVTIF